MEYVSKKFLSTRADETGSIAIGLSYTTGEYASPINNKLYPNSVDGSIQVRDCYKQIELSLNANNAEEVDERLDKIDLLISELTELRKQYAVYGAKAKMDWILLEEKNLAESS